MTTTDLRCPDCGSALTGGTECSSCGLPLQGPTAARLWQLDQRLGLLDAERGALLAERVRLIAVLRSGEAPLTWAPAPPTPTTLPVYPAAARKESSPQSVQNTLLGLGALLLALAGIVFAAVTYQRLGVGGRAAVLLTLTGLATVATVPLIRRGLTASAEAVTAVTLVLSALDAWALRRAGVADTVDARSYAAVATAALALAAGAHALALPVRASRIGATLFAQLPALYVLDRVDASLPVVAVTLTGLAAVDLVVAVERRVPPELRRLTAVLGGLGLVAALAASVAAVADHDRGGSVGLLAIAIVAAVAAWRVTDAGIAALLGGSVVPLLAGAAWAAVRPELTEPQWPLVVVAVALFALQVAGLLPRSRRDGPVTGALVVAGVALLLEVEPVLLALAGPFTWLADPWTLTATDARHAIAVDQPWTGTVVTLVVLVAVAGCAVAAGVVLDRVRPALMPAGVLLVLSAVVLPLGLATTYTAALVLLLVVAAALAGIGTVLLDRSRELGLALVTTGVTTALLAGVWALAARDATLAVLPAAALLAAALAVLLPGVLTGTAALLVGAELAAYGADRDLSPEQVGGLLLLAPAACVALSLLCRGAHRLGLETAAALLAGTSVVLAVEDPGWLSWTLAVSGLLCVAVAFRPDRREIGLAGGLLLSASSWVRLADANVHAPEPYVAPLALAALLFGHLRRRTQPGLSSFAAYGAGLTVALVPSLLKALDDPTPTRGLLLLVVAAGVVVAGVHDRLRAPLVIGGVVLAIDAVHLVAPYASALPRWTLLAVAGTVLVLLGATYEQRLRDVARLRERYDGLR